MYILELLEWKIRRWKQSKLKEKLDSQKSKLKNKFGNRQKNDTEG
jgi:hypothetical protein